jgi:hypothetical protein
MNCVRRKVGIGLRESQGAIQDVEGLHGVANVHDFGIGNDVENHAFHCAHKVIVEAKVGG